MKVNYIKGRNPVLEALRGGRKVKEIVFAENIKTNNVISEIKKLAKKNKVPCKYFNPGWLSSRAGKNHQGVLASVESYDCMSLEDFLKDINSPSSQPVLILDSVEDPRNLGAIIRTAECAGIAGVIIPDRRAAGITHTVEKASAGALAYMPVVMAVNLNNAILKLKDMGYWVYGLSLGEGTKNYTQVDLTGSVCIVLGNEGKGIRPSIEKNCDFLLKLPLLGNIDSLNVSVACGIILYEVLRQRKERESKSKKN